MISVGLELGANVIKIAVVEAARGTFRVRDFEVHRLDARKGEAEDDVVSIVNDALKRLKAPRNAVVASVRAMDCMIREILVPFTEDDKIRKTIKYQAENYFSSIPIDDLIIEYSRFAEVDTKSRLLVAGIKKSHIDRRLRFLQECSVDPQSIDLDVGALYNTYAHLDLFAGKGAALIVDIEADTLKIGVVEEGRLRLARALRMRVESMRLDRPRKAAGPAESIHDTQADESARLPVVILDEGDDDVFSLEDSDISETEREGIIHRIFMEIDRTVASVNMAHEVEEILLTGPSCALEGIETIFSDHFEIPARRVDIREAFALKEPKGKRMNSSLQAPTAIGLALKGLGIDHSGMDFRQEEFAYRGAFDKLKRGLACTLTLLFALVFLQAFSLKTELRERNETVLAVKTMQKNLYTVLFPALDSTQEAHLPLASGKPEQGRYYESLRAEHTRLRNKYQGSEDEGDQVSALEVLRRFSLALSRVEKRWGIEVVKVKIETAAKRKSNFVCLASHQGGATELQRSFQADDLVKATAQQVTKDRNTDKWRFTLVVERREVEG